MPPIRAAGGRELRLASNRARFSTVSHGRDDPGPLIRCGFRRFPRAYRDPGALSPLAAGTLGGLLATWVTFVPCFLWIFLGAPFIERLRGNPAVAAALSAITAAVVGVVLNLALWFALHTLFRETAPFNFGPAFDAPVRPHRSVRYLLGSAGSRCASSSQRDRHAAPTLPRILLFSMGLVGEGYAADRGGGV